MPKKKNTEIKTCVFFPIIEIWKQIPNAIRNGPRVKIFWGVELEIQGGVKVFTVIVLAFEFLNYSQVLI